MPRKTGETMYKTKEDLNQRIEHQKTRKKGKQNIYSKG